MSRMSSDFLSQGGTPPRSNLVPLLVHPSDYERLKSLAGIWPMEDTITRLIDVFLATGATSASQAIGAGVRAEPARATSAKNSDEPPPPNVEIAAPALTGPEPAQASGPLAPPQRAETRAVTLIRKPEPAPEAPKGASRAGSATATPVKPEPKPLTFNRTDYPDLKFTALDGFSFGEVTRDGSGLTWCLLFEEAVAQALAAGHGPEALAAAGVRVRTGKHSERGFRWCERLGLSVQVSTSNYMFIRVLRLSDLIGAPVRVGLSWEKAAGASHPGKSGLIVSKPLPRPAPRPQQANLPLPDAPGPQARFPTPGCLVSFVYQDRADEDKLVQLVTGPADPVAGQVSVASPLGRALLDTAVGGTAVLEIKGAERLIRVLDVLTA